MGEWASKKDIKKLIKLIKSKFDAFDKAKLSTSGGGIGNNAAVPLEIINNGNDETAIGFRNKGVSLGNINFNVNRFQIFSDNLSGIKSKWILLISNGARNIYDYKSGTLKEILVTGDTSGSVNLSRIFAGDANYKPGKDIFEVKEFGATSDNIPSSDWYHIITMQGDDVREDFVTQLAVGMTTDSLYYRRFYTGTWGTWRKILLEGDVTCFQPGETFSIAKDMPFVGFITSGSVDVIFTIPMPRNISERDISIKCPDLEIRCNGMYLTGGGSWGGDDISMHNVIYEKSNNFLGVRLRKKDGSKWADVNNSVVTVDGNFTITFS